MSTPQLTTVIDKAFLGRLCADAIINLQKAVEKHPTFPCELTAADSVDMHDILDEIREQNATGDTNAQLIAYEEELELFIETETRSLPLAYDELVDLITVWLRVGLHLKDYVSHRGTEDTEVKNG